MMNNLNFKLIFSPDGIVKETFKDACKVYYDRCVVTGRCFGGPGDIMEADDSESAGALTDALGRALLSGEGRRHQLHHHLRR